MRLHPPSMQAPALIWDEKLAASAKKWADTCTFGVSGTPGVGEALGFGYSTFPDAVKGWYNQVRVCVSHSCSGCVCVTQPRMTNRAEAQQHLRALSWNRMCVF